MKRPPSKLKLRIAYEPNRFSSATLNEVYERLAPIKSRTVSKDKDLAQVEDADGVHKSHVEDNQ
jgi:hypothetical protein